MLRKMMSVMLSCMLLLMVTGAVAEESVGGRGMQQGGGMRAGGGAVDKSGDAELQTMIAEVVPQFELLSFTDDESGITLQYYLYTPTAAAENYPLVMFIPDSSVVGQAASAVLTQGWGGLVFATEESQATNPCYVLVPVFTDTVVDDSFSTSPQIDVAVKIITSLCESEPIDTNRLYTTGQSMGGMTSFHLNLTYPDLFAASIFVGSQWNVAIMSPLESSKFFYIVSAGDPKASAGQAELMALFDADAAAYAKAEWSAQDSEEVQSQAVEALLEQGCDANFVTFALGSTTADGQASTGGAGEHMTSFDYAYKLDAVRAWLFAQSK